MLLSAISMIIAYTLKKCFLDPHDYRLKQPRICLKGKSIVMFGVLTNNSNQFILILLLLF